MFNKYPYTDFHELNLDFFVRQLKELSETVENWIAFSEVKFASPIEWSPSEYYRKNTIVLGSDGNSYISKDDVPVGIGVTDDRYWYKVGNYNAQIVEVENDVEELREDVDKFKLSRPYVTPEMYGAVGDGITNDSDAFTNALNSGFAVVLANKTYLIDFMNYDLTNKTIIGSGKENCVILNRNQNNTFGTVGINTVLSDFKLDASNAVIPVLKFSGNLTNHDIEHLNIRGGAGCVGMLFDINAGSPGGIVNDIRVQNCDYAIKFNVETYLTAQAITNCNFNSFYKSGIFIEGNGLISHTTIDKCNFYCNWDGTAGIDMSANYGICFSNCNVFNDNASGIAHSFKIHPPVNLANYKMPKLVNGIYEGAIDEKLLNALNPSEYTLFVVRNYNGAVTHNIRGNVNAISKISHMPLQHYKDDNVVYNNLSVTTGADLNGKFIKLSATGSPGYMRIQSPYVDGEYVTAYVESDKPITNVIYDDGTAVPEFTRIQYNADNHTVYSGVVFGTPRSGGIANNIQINVPANTSVKLYALGVTEGINYNKITTMFPVRYDVVASLTADSTGTASLSNYPDTINVARVTNANLTARLSSRPTGELVSVTDQVSTTYTAVLQCVAKYEYN